MNMNQKNMTARIVVENPELKDLENHLAGRKICPLLLEYFRKVVAIHKGGTRKINIPSTHDNVGVALLGSSSLEETFLQMHDELHVFFAGKVVIVKWEVRNEDGFCVPTADLSTLEIKKVQVEGEKVTINLTSSKVDFSMLVDFELYSNETTTLNIDHPLNQKPAQ